MQSFKKTQATRRVEAGGGDLQGKISETVAPGFVRLGPAAADGPVAEGRFKDNSNYLDRFYKPDCFEAIRLIEDACAAHNISLLDASFSWLLNHSELQEGDGVLLGASSVEQLEQNLVATTAIPELPADVLAAMDQAWGLCADDAFAFWRSYSSDHPDREALDPGAAYVATKPKL